MFRICMGDVWGYICIFMMQKKCLYALQPDWGKSTMGGLTQLFTKRIARAFSHFFRDVPLLTKSQWQLRYRSGLNWGRQDTLSASYRPVSDQFGYLNY